MGSTFKTDFSDPGNRTLLALMFGRPKIGKTRCLLDIARKEGNYLILISTDRGARPHLMREPEVFKKKVALAEPSGLQEMRECISEAGTMVKKLLGQGVLPTNIWIAVDTVTHLQIKLLQEARKIDLRAPATTDRSDEEFVRDFQTEVDWGINLTLMSEQADKLVSLGVNLVYVALERTEKPKGQPEKPVPALSGQSRDRLMGDVDVILHMAQGDDGKRFFETDYRGGAGDRTGRLDRVEEPSLLGILNKVFRSTNGSAATDTKTTSNEEAQQ